MKSFLEENCLKIVGFIIAGTIVLYFLLLISDTIFSALMHLGNTHNSPWHFYQYFQIYYHDPKIFRKLILSLLAPFVLVVAAIIIYFQNKISPIYGNAHFASFSEARKAGLFSKKGILLGKKWGKFLCIGGHEHVIVFAPSGSGKTRGVSIPNLLTWQDSIICSDVKLELYKTTAEFRKKHGQKCYLWNPGSQDGKTNRYNPLGLIKDNKITRVDDAQKIASIFIPDNPRTDPIWYTLPRTLFVALILYVLDTKGIPNTIGAIMRLVKSTPNFTDFLLEVLSERTDLDPVCRNNFHLFLQLPEKTQGSILAAFLSHFELFDNELIDQATSSSDFDIRNLRKEPMTIYVGITNDNLTRLAPLTSVFYQQVIDVMTRNEPDKNEPYSVLFLMDEFAALKKMDTFEKNMGLFRSYHLRVLTIVQDLSQLKREYGEEGAKIFINSKVKIAFTQNDLETAKWISDIVGCKTIRIKNTSQRTQNIFDKTESTILSGQSLLSPQNVLSLSSNKALLIMEGYSPVICQKTFWDKERGLRNRISSANN